MGTTERAPPSSCADPGAARSFALRYALALAVFALLVWVPVWVALERHCLHNFDAGIIPQLWTLASWADLDPYVPFRAVRMSRDHVDPIIVLGAPLVRVVEPAFAAILFEAAFVLAAPLALWPLVRRGRIDPSALAVGFALLLFQRAVVSAVQFPAHPTTWAVAPLAWLATMLPLGARGGVLAALTIAFACKEEFPFVGIAAGLWLVFGRRDRRLGGAVLAWSALWMGWAFGLRHVVLGPVHDYGGDLLAAVLADPAGALARNLAPAPRRRIVDGLLPLLPLVLWLARERLAPRWELLLLAAPLIAIRALAGAWRFHHAAPVATLVALALLPLARPGEPPPRVPRWVTATTLALLLLVNGQALERAVGAYVPARARASCPADPARLASIETGRALLLADPGAPALVGGNLAPRLAALPLAFQVAGSQEPGARTFRYVFVEKPPRGDPWPISKPRLAELIEAWRREPGAEVLQDDTYTFLARGEFRIDR